MSEITDFLLWAEQTENVRLPGIDRRLDNLDDGLAQKGEKVAQIGHDVSSWMTDATVRLGTAETDVDANRLRTSEAMAQIYSTGLNANLYTDERIQQLKDELTGTLTGLRDGIIDSIGQELLNGVDGRLLDTLQRLTDLVNGTDSTAGRISAEMVQLQLILDAILLDDLPKQRAEIDAALDAANAASAALDAALADFFDGSIMAGLDRVSQENAEKVAEVREHLDAMVEGLQQDSAAIAGEVSGVRDALAAEAQALRNEAGQIDARVTQLRSDLTSTTSQIALDLASNLASAKGYVETSIQTYDEAVQGQILAMAGQIEQLTAALTSANLVGNGLFALGDTSWAFSNTTFLVREEQTGVPAAAPHPHLAHLGTTAAASISTTLTSFAVSANDRMQIRLSAASPASGRTFDIAFAWLNASGGIISTTTETLSTSQAATWSVYSKQFDPPDTAVGAVLTISRPNGGSALYITGVEASTVNIALEARVTQLEAAQVTTDDVTALISQKVDGRFADASAAVTNEASLRVAADTALGNRMTEVEAATGTNASTLSQVQTALSDAQAATAQLDERLTASFGKTQLVRDPGFREGLAHWPSGTLGNASSLINREPASTDLLLSTMPDTRAFTLEPGSAANRATDLFEVSPAELYTAGFWYYRGSATAAHPTILFQWFRADRSLIQNGTFFTGREIGAWTYMSAGDIKPHADARFARFLIFGRSMGTTRDAYITGATAAREAPYEQRSKADIAELKQVNATQDGAFAGLKETVTSNWNSLDGRVKSNATAISERYTKAETNQAIGVVSDKVDTKFGEADAAIKAEAALRSNADGALATRLTAVESKNSTQDATISSQGTAIANAQAAIAQVDDRVTATFGKTQLVRDPGFSSDLAHWFGALGSVDSLVARDVSSSELHLNTMPDGKAFKLEPRHSGHRAGDWFDVSPAERYSVGFYYFRASETSPVPRMLIQWVRADRSLITNSETLLGQEVGKWDYVSLSDMAPPPDTKLGRILFYTNSTGSAGNAYITGMTANRQAPYEHQSKAEIAALKQANATQDGAFASLQELVTANWNSLDGRVRSQATAIENRYTKADADAAIGVVNTKVDTKFGEADAAIKAEAKARSDALGAAATRMSAIEAKNGTQDTTISSQGTAISNATSAIAQLDERVTSTFGKTQLVRDPGFVNDFAHWFGNHGTADTRLTARNLTSEHLVQRTMPEAKALQFLAGDAGTYRYTDFFEVSPGERYSFGIYCFRSSTLSRRPRVYIQWFNKNKALLGNSQVIDTDAVPIDEWTYLSQINQKPHADAVFGRLSINSALAGTQGSAWLTGGTVNRVAAYEQQALAEIETLKQAWTDPNGAFAALKNTVTANWNSLDGRVKSNATAIDNRYTKTETDTAISAVQTKLSAALDKQTGGVISDPTLATAGWVRWGGQGTLQKIPNRFFETGTTWDFNVAAGRQDGMQILASPDAIWPGAKNAEAYVVEIAWSHLSGSISHTQILLDWNTSDKGEFRVEMNLGAMQTGQFTSSLRHSRGLFKRPSNFSGTFSSHDLYVMASYGSTSPAVRVQFHQVLVRPASQEELGRGEVMSSVQAHLTQNFMTKATTEAAISAAETRVDASYGPTKASASRSATALANLSGSVARVKDVVTVDGQKVAGLEAVAFTDTGGVTRTAMTLHGDNTIAKGTMSARAFVSGVGGNLLIDPSFDDGLAHYFFGSQHGGNAGVREAGEGWAHPGWPTLYIHQPNANAAGYSSLFAQPMNNRGGGRASGVPVKAGKHYTASVYLSLHRCEGQLFIQWMDANGNALSGAPESARAPNNGGGQFTPDDWPRIEASGTAPAGAHFARLIFRKYGTLAGTDSWMFIWKPQLEEVAFAGQEAGKWGPGGTTVMDGGRILTKTIYADSLNVSSLAAVSATIGTLRTATTGERLEIHSNMILVYDANNVIRVRMGQL